MKCSDTIRERRSIRKYKADEMIPQEHIEMMLEAAMMAPSARNTRPWEFFVVKNQEVKNSFMEVMPYAQMLQTAPLAIVVCGRPDLQEGICSPYWPLDCGAAIENLLLQAKALGYGTCWCGCYPTMDRAEGLQKILKTEAMPTALIAVGVPDEAPAARGYFDPERVTYID